MLNEIFIIVAAAIFTSFVSMKCCIYTAIIAFLILSTLGMSPVYCVGYVREVDGENHYHAWVRIGSYDIEQSTLNLRHYDVVNYSEPDITFNTTSSFIDRMDMLSPVRWLMQPKHLYRIDDTYSIAPSVQENKHNEQIRNRKQYQNIRNRRKQSWRQQHDDCDDR